MRAFLFLGLLAAAALADKPDDLPCVTWEPLTSFQNTPDPSTLFVAAVTWVITSAIDPSQCLYQGDVIPCFASDSGSNTWGHHDYQNDQILSDYCRTWINGSVYYSNNMYVPKKGPKWQTWEWQLTQKGATVPANAIRYQDKVMAMSTVNPPGHCTGKGFTGWAHGLENGTFGSVHFGLHLTPVQTNSFKVAICKAYHPTPAPPTPAPATPNPPPAPTPPPTLPPSNKPYIRFGHTIATSNKVWATITQGATSYTWENYGYGEFSGWVQVFSDGFGTITVYEADGTSKGRQLVTKNIPLTPGPLVVVIMGYWPLSDPNNIETIAASYVPPVTGSGVRLFNLAPDVTEAGMKEGSTALVNNVKYTLGSSWAPITDAQGTFTVFDTASGATLASDTFTPPNAPFVFTNFLIGQKNQTGTFGPKLVPLIDAPEHL